MSVELVPDPEMPDDEQVVYQVLVTGTADEISLKQRIWRHRLHVEIPRSPRIYSILMNYYE
jgi:hypothetical protein